MSLCNFLHFNDRCPVCGKNLTLYMHVAKSALWRSKPNKNGVHVFEQFLLKKEEWSSQDYITLFDRGDYADVEYSSNKLELASREWELYFFKACGDAEAFKDNKFDYDVNWYDICYHRTSPYYSFKQRRLELMAPEHSELINRDESLIFKTANAEGLEKVYALSLDYENKHTKLWYYTTTLEQRKEEDFDPNIFEKTDLPLLSHRPDFSLEHRDQLLDRLTGWILLS